MIGFVVARSPIEDVTNGGKSIVVMDRAVD
jgi:hypothetical protein